MSSIGRVFGIVTSANSIFYTHRALQSFFLNTKLTVDDEVYLIDNDNVCKIISNVIIIKNEKPLTFAENANQLIDIARASNKDLIFLSNDIILTPNWLTSLELDNTITIPSCNQTHLYSKLTANMDWADYNNEYAQLCDHSLLHKQQVTENFDLLLMPFYVFRLPKDVYNIIGYFDTTFVNGGEDLDYRIRAIIAGIDVKYAAQSYVLHFNGKSTWRNSEHQYQIELCNKKYRDRLVEKWGYDLMSFMTLGGDPNTVLTKFGLMQFNRIAGFHNKLIQQIYQLSNRSNQ